MIKPINIVKLSELRGQVLDYLIIESFKFYSYLLLIPGGGVDMCVI